MHRPPAQAAIASRTPVRAELNTSPMTDPGRSVFRSHRASYGGGHEQEVDTDLPPPVSPADAPCGHLHPPSEGRRLWLVVLHPLTAVTACTAGTPPLCYRSGPSAASAQHADLSGGVRTQRRLAALPQPPRPLRCRP